MLSGRLEKALKYADKAQAQIEQIKNIDHSPFLMAVEMLFYECRIQSHLIFDNKYLAIKEVRLTQRGETADFISEMLIVQTAEFKIFLNPNPTGST